MARDQRHGTVVAMSGALRLGRTRKAVAQWCGASPRATVMGVLAVAALGLSAWNPCSTEASVQAAAMSVAASMLVAAAVFVVERYTSVYKADHDLPRALSQLLASPAATVGQADRALASMTKSPGRRLTGQVLDADTGLFVGFGAVKTTAVSPADSHSGLVLHLLWRDGLTATVWELEQSDPEPQVLSGPAKLDGCAELADALSVALANRRADLDNNLRGVARFLPELLARTWAADRDGELLLAGSVRAAMGSDWLVSVAVGPDPKRLELLRIDTGARLTSPDLNDRLVFEEDGKEGTVKRGETLSGARARWYEVRAVELSRSLPKLVEKSRESR